MDQPGAGAVPPGGGRATPQAAALSLPDVQELLREIAALGEARCSQSRVIAQADRERRQAHSDLSLAHCRLEEIREQVYERKEQLEEEMSASEAPLLATARTEEYAGPETIERWMAALTQAHLDQTRETHAWNAVLAALERELREVQALLDRGPD